MIKFDTFLAKSDGTTLFEHTNHVITAGKNLIERLSFTSDEKSKWKEKLVRCAILHDLGKIHPFFQKRLNGDKVVHIRHEIISLWFCDTFLNLEIDELFAIGTHHKGVCKAGENKRLDPDDLKDYLNCQLNLSKELCVIETLSAWLKIFNCDEKMILNTEFSITLSIETIKSLKFEQQKKQFQDTKSRYDMSLMRGLLIAADHIGSAQIQDKIPTPRLLQLSDFQPKKEGVAVPFRQFQIDLQTWKGDVILHAPTGSGKTEAALSWIYANQTPNARIFYTLPYTASINAMVKRLQEVYGEDKELVTALHSKSLDFFYDEAEEEASNYEERKEKAENKKEFSKKLFYPVKVTTLHQILKNALMGKGWDMALFDYQNALFVFDEFHTYDPLITGMMMATVNWLRDNFNAKIMFMSATIPKFMLEKLVKCSFGENQHIIKRPNPNIASDAQILDKKRHKLICVPQKQIKDEYDLILKIIESKPQRSILIIVNNVATCQKIYTEFEKYDPTLLHGGLHRLDRKTNEKKITNPEKQKRPKLLIATQAVEVSLDIDYEVAFIENAPIDALIQRLGRVNRAGNVKECAEVYIFENSMGDIKRIYDPIVCKNTFKELLKLDGQELTESNLVEVCNTVYAAGYIGDDKDNFEQGFKNDTINEFNDKLIAGHWEDWIEQVLEKSNSKIDVLCGGKLFSKYVELINQGKIIDAQQLFVQIYFWESKEIQRVLKDKRHNPKYEKYNVLVADDLEYEEGYGYKNKVNSNDQFL